MHPLWRLSARTSDAKEPILRPNTVTLMTIHGAMGKEFDYVYLIGMVDDASFQSRRKATKPEMEEERRNCFVAITRTIETSCSVSRSMWRLAKEPSRFL
jgi:DNA helicase-2/ATP-dependent DNA helicase PcrA